MRAWGGRAVVIVSCVALAFGASPAAAGSPPKHPKRWDERVLPFVRFVEKARGLDFKHPVSIRLLDERAFRRAAREDQEWTARDRKIAAQQSGELIALGLADHRVDLEAVIRDDQESLIGFYDTKREELVVRGTDIDRVETRVTVVHELTHALQDQHFDLDALEARTSDSSEQQALASLIEGDATVVEFEYTDTLSPDESEEYYDWIASFPTPPGEIPPALVSLWWVPYNVGPGYVFALDDEGGTKQRDAAFQDPPQSEEVLIDPVALAQDQRPKRVPAPKRGDDEEKVYGPHPFGAITLYLVLSTHLDARTALRAVTGWGGDRYIGFRRGRTACLRANVVGDTTADTDELEAALRAWRDVMPPGAVEVARNDGIITFTACEADGVAEPSTEVVTSAFDNILFTRVFTVLTAVASENLSLGDALCVADYQMTDPEAMALNDAAFAADRTVPTDEELALFDAVRNRAFDECKVA
jgi:hypothetical protein